MNYFCFFLLCSILFSMSTYLRSRSYIVSKGFCIRYKFNFFNVSIISIGGGSIRKTFKLVYFKINQRKRLRCNYIFRWRTKFLRKLFIGPLLKFYLKKILTGRNLTILSLACTEHVSYNWLSIFKVDIFYILIWILLPDNFYLIHSLNMI